MSGVWKSSLGLAVWLVEVPTRWSRPSLVFLGRLVRLPRTGEAGPVCEGGWFPSLPGGACICLVVP